MEDKEHRIIKCPHCGTENNFYIQKLELSGIKYTGFDRKDKLDQEKYSCEQFIMKCANDKCKKFISLLPTSEVKVE